MGDEAAYTPVATTTGNAVAVGRGAGDRVEVVAVVTRLAVSLASYGGWREHTVSLPEGRWRDEPDRPRGRRRPGAAARAAR
ncbi:hypothetical protein GCM10025868_04770 [Angustibacter aerolatus]|uniref:Uncharacterized protein n=1 Tax=Angustibacter aerolatus TaxID=1162965 RepID=A0ABQ6JAL5_9ACTN|nr:hypothetical protein GCM10025868_04770 [Angustibacter aerolatus]